ncbi:hypothetical protein [Rubrivirga sp. IMCC43871]|uniref:hypothetical protein n=1 Tax=Rubrivirga sp. IMCC43871 TaxID=3391575 RepID=UPI00398FAF4B
MSRVFPVLLALLAVSASAQVGPLDGRGVYGAFGSVAPERLLFPEGSSPEITVGARLSPRVDVQLGLTVTETRASRFDRQSISVHEDLQRRGGAVASVGVADRWGESVVRGRVSLGYDDYSAQTTNFRPDSVEVWTRTGLEDALALLPSRSRTSLGKYVQAGASASIGWPVGRGRVRAVPGIGVAGSLAGRVSGERQAQGARLMPYAVVPVSARVAGVAVTATLTGGLAGGERDQRRGVEPFGASARASTWVPIVEGSLRLDL